MVPCTEISVFEVKEEDIGKAIELSLAIFSEMNGDGEVITASEVLRRTGNSTELCWHLTWLDEAAAKTTTARWPSFSSTKAFEELIVKDHYHGHFVRV